MSMAPKDGDIIKNGIAALLRGFVGMPGDTGGSQTAGTVMAKENAILKKLLEMDEKVVNNLILKRSEPKQVTIASNAARKINFTFEKPVKFLAVQVSGSVTGQGTSTNSAGTAVPTYLINGEDSFTITLYHNNQNGYYTLQWSYTTSPMVNTGLILSNGSSQSSNREQPSFNPWITQFEIQFPANSVTEGKVATVWILYQEEG